MHSFFGQLLESPRNSLVDKAIEQDSIPIGYTCSYVPDVLLSVGKLFPVRMRAPGVSGTEIADTYLSSLICSYTRSILEFALENRYDFLGGWVFTASCDHLRRLHDNLNYLVKPGFTYMLDLPHKTGDEALGWYAEEIKNLAESLSSRFGVDMGAAAINAAISARNEFLSLLRELGETRKTDNPCVTGTEFHQVLLAAFTTPQDLIAGSIREFLNERKANPPSMKYRARLLLVGGQMDDPAYINIIESQGGLVVADRFCTGSFPGLNLIRQGGDPYRALANHYLYKTACPRMMEMFRERTDDIIKIFKEYRADGIVIQTIKFCDTWGVESGPLVSSLREAGIPVLRVEREYRLSGEGQLRTRVQAFIESMGK